MHYGILAAGEGSRLRQDGILLPKPLVMLRNERMIDRLIRIFLANGATAISVIVNEYMTEVSDYLYSLSLPVPFYIIRKTTDNSFHSFYELQKSISDDRFCITTIDTVFDERDFTSFIDTFHRTKEDGLIPVTRYVDDESPLYVSTDDDMNIIAFTDEKMPCYVKTYISGGIFGLTKSVVPTLKVCREKDIRRMRNFQKEMISQNVSLKAVLFSKIMDIDRRSDLESFLSA